MKLSFECEYECEFSQRFATPASLCILSTHSTHFLLHPTSQTPITVGQNLQLAAS